MTNEKMSHGISRRFWILFLVLSLVPMLSCGRYRARHERKRNEYFAEILKRVDRHWIGDDRFFEDNLLANPYPQVRQWCALALARIGSARALPLLYRASLTGDASVRAASAFAIGAIEDHDLLGMQYSKPDPETSRQLVRLLNDSSISVQMRAVEALGKMGSHPETVEIVRRLERFSCDGSPAGRSFIGYAITALARLRDPTAFPVLERLANSSDPEVRWRALDALARLEDEKASRLFIRNLDSSHPQVLAYAARGISNLDSGAANYLLRLLPPRDNRTGKPIPVSVRASAIQALGKLKNRVAIPSIKAAINADPLDEASPDQQNFAVLAAVALGEIGSAEAEPVLLPLLHSVQPAANSAVIALAKILKGNPGRFFTLVDRNRFSAPAALPAWIQSMAELGSPDAVEELNRLLVRALENPIGSQSKLLPDILKALAKANPQGLQEILGAFLRSRNAAVLSTAVAAYQPNANAKEPWIPIVEAFNGCCPGGDTEARPEILLHLAPWIGEAKVQQVLWNGLEDPDRNVRLAALALLRKSGTSVALEDPGPSTASLSDAVCLTLAASRKNSTIAIMKTTRGTLEIELFREEAPLTVADFKLMAQKGDFNGFVFEQVIPFQRIGAKDVELRTEFGRAANGEINLRPFERGSLGITPAAGKFQTGRFFIALAPQPYFDGVNTCFGRIISGIQVADRIVPGDRILGIDIKETISFLDHVQY
jgi:HEAT repeat protein/cyclophilin family peptidyl-prolyl cis-trans isomerase